MGRGRAARSSLVRSCCSFGLLRSVRERRQEGEEKKEKREKEKGKKKKWENFVNMEVSRKIK
jgi:hypothetical protein